MNYDLLVIAGALSFLAAALHICVIVGGASWYRFFGAGETMALLAERGSVKPAFITLAISLILFVWGLYAWSGAGLLPKMPFLKLGLVTITTIYLVRGLGGLIAPFASDHPQIKQNSVNFWVWSSIVCLVIGMVHLSGVVSKWQVL
jgi:putative oxidoreductase